MKIYKGYLIERVWHNGYYVSRGKKCRLMSDTLFGIIALIKEDIKAAL